MPLRFFLFVQTLLSGFFVSYFLAYSYEDVSFVKAGSFLMGSDKGQVDEAPKHSVWVSGFFIDRFEISIREWNRVTTFAEDNGYAFSETQKFPKRGPSWFTGADRLDFPMNMITWFDAIKWCNARSEFMGRLPVYYDSESNEILRSQNLNSSSAVGVYWNRSGYRLPTEAEWEKAARGIAGGYKFPWGNSIDGSMANYKLSGDPFDNGTTPVGYYNGSQEIVNKEFSFGGENTSPPDRKNSYNIYDVVGNVSEWCWDWYDQKWYDDPKNTNRDDRGPMKDDLSNLNPPKVHRGASFSNDNTSENGESLRIAFRNIAFPDEFSTDLGMRSVRGEFHDLLWADASESKYTGWKILPWLGYFYPAKNSWSYFPDLKWVYPVGHCSYDNWLYLHAFERWVWTCKYVYPWFYDFNEKTWVEFIVEDKKEVKFLSVDSSIEILPLK